MVRPLVPYSETSSDEEDQKTQIKSDYKKPLKSENVNIEKSKIKSDQSKKEINNEDQKRVAKRTWDDNLDLYHMELQSERLSRRYRLKSRVYEIRFEPFEDPFDWTHDSFNAMMNQIKQDCGAKSKDKMRVSFMHPALDHGIFIPFDDCNNMTGETVLNEFERVAQSNDRFNIHDGHMTAEITLISMPSGSSRKNMHHGAEKGVENMTCSKRSIIQIQNDKDNSCFARAVVVGIAHATKTDTAESKRNWKYICKSDRPLQQQKAQELLAAANLQPDQACGIEEFTKIQTHLYPDYIIKVHAQHEKSEMLFKPWPMQGTSKVIHIYYHDQHYDTIVSIKGFLGRVYYCEYCDKGYNTLAHHRCSNTCECLAPVRCPTGQPVTCQTCKGFFRSSECYQKHLQVRQTKSACDLLRRCETCGQMVVVDGQQHHRCKNVKRKCKYCKELVESDHDCYIPTYTAQNAKKKPNVPYIFYDFECKFDTGTHMPNFCVAQRACNNCICRSVQEPCQHCDIQKGQRQMIFKGNDTLKDFCAWLFDPIHKGATAIAHNAQGYDAQFILRHVLTHGTAKPDPLIMNGSKIILMDVYEVRFIDSMSFLAMPLSDFPKTFGITELAKGWFPFWLNTEEYQDYVGPYPQPYLYRPGTMKPENRSAFLAWHMKQVKEGKIFDFQKEMEKYCISDVDILRRGCGEFMKQMLASDGINPFLEATTLAQACNQAWRKNSMPEQSLGIISDAGYPHKTRYSMKGIRWIQLEAHQTKTNIQHALNGGEKQLGPYFVDGYDETTMTVYEFNGCFWHGCETCFPNRKTPHPIYNKPYGQLYNETLEKQFRLTQQGFKVISMWECQFDRLCKDDPQYKQQVAQFYPHLDPIAPREALFGGRTNAVRLYHEIDESKGEEIKYVDVCSLYPYVNKYREYPLGHPKILSQEQIDRDHIEQYHGLIKCKVLPPNRLWLPVLPIHCNKKMVFTLCKTCAEQEERLCSHSNNDRALVGTWTSVELNKALSLGYRLLEIYQIWHWDEWSDKVYSQYVNKYLKMKQEASGYPEEVQTPEQQNQFKQDYYEAEGILLEHVEKNPGKRAFAKTMLNCLWGKNAQNNIRPKTKYVKERAELHELLTSKLITVNYVETFDHDDFLLVNFTDQSDVIQPHSSANVVVASFVTAYARLVLYEELEKLGKRVLYFDTDSCMYISVPGEYDVPITNSRLGQWTDEVPEGKIVRFVALGPKNYGYEYIVDGKRRTTCKVKGITLDYNTSQQVNFNSMVQAVKERDTFSLKVEYESKIKRHRNRRVTSETQSKTFRSVYTKRVVVDKFNTYPYGYHKK